MVLYCEVAVGDHAVKEHAVVHSENILGHVYRLESNLNQLLARDCVGDDVVVVRGHYDALFGPVWNADWGYEIANIRECVDQTIV